MLIESWPASKLIPYAANARQITPESISKVAASIKEFGFRQPIVVDKEGIIIAGHTRLLAAQQLGMDTVPVHVADKLTPAQVKQYRLMDNRSHQESRWDYDLLKVELGEMVALDMDLSLTGFDPGELESFLVEQTEGLTDPDDVPAIADDAISVLGDVWQLGNHRIICGSSTEADTVDKLLGPIKPHLMVTDPPYGVEYDAGWRDEAAKRSPSMGNRKDTAKGKVLNDDKADWREAWILFPGEVAYVWHAGVMAAVVAESLVAADFGIRSQIIWAKNHLAIGRSHYHWQHEPCWYAVKNGGKGYWAGDRKQTTLWQIEKPKKSETGHSTQKPIECMKRPIENNSSPGQAVYEPFSGSGTTIIAAEMTGRHCYAIELNPLYVDMAVKRWQQFTGKQAVHLDTGIPFDDHAKEQGRKAAS